ETGAAANLGHVALGVGLAFDHKGVSRDGISASTRTNGSQAQVQFTGTAQSAGALDVCYFAGDVSAFGEQCPSIDDHGSGEGAVKLVADVGLFAAELFDDAYLQLCAWGDIGIGLGQCCGSHQQHGCKKLI